MGELGTAIKYWLLAEWRGLTHYDLKGDLQMEQRAAWQDVKDAWYELRGERAS